MHTDRHTHTRETLAHAHQKKKAEGPAEPQQPAKRKPPSEPVAMETPARDPEALRQEVEAQGNKVRELKSSGAEKVRGEGSGCGLP